MLYYYLIQAVLYMKMGNYVHTVEIMYDTEEGGTFSIDLLKMANEGCIKRFLLE